MKPIRVFTARYGFRRGNSGDECSLHVLRALLPGREIIVESEPERANLFAVGSVLDKIPVGQPRRRAVWGTGLIDEFHRLTIPEGDDVGVFAVRGPLTAVRVRLGGAGLTGDLPYGDAGVLVSEVWPRMPDTPTRYRLGVVAHYVDMDDNELCVLARRHGDEVTVIDPCAPVHDVLRGIAECEAVLSSSLHGLVFAESIGIPSAWFRISDKIAGGSFKFRDWYTALREETDPLPMSMAEAHGLSISEIVSRCTLNRGDEVEAMRLRLIVALESAVAWLDAEPESEQEDTAWKGTLDHDPVESVKVE